MTCTDGRACIRVAIPGCAPHEPTPAHATYPTSHGAVAVVWEWEDETVRVDLTAPQAIALEIALPIRAAAVYVNGETVWADNAFRENSAGVVAVEESPGGIRLACPAGGAYHILACTSEALADG